MKKSFVILLSLFSMSASAQTAISIYEDCSKNGTTLLVHNNHEYVDLGLSVEWATSNVGALNSMILEVTTVGVK